MAWEQKVIGMGQFRVHAKNTFLEAVLRRVGAKVVVAWMTSHPEVAVCLDWTDGVVEEIVQQQVLVSGVSEGRRQHNL